MANPELIARRGRLYESKKRFEAIDNSIDNDLILLRMKTDPLGFESNTQIDVDSVRGITDRLFKEVHELRDLDKLIKDLCESIGELP